MNLVFSSLISSFLGAGVLLYLDASTLFLAALLLAVVAVKSLNKGDFLDKLTGVWFALSVAPAVGVNINEVSELNNGFLIQTLLSFLLFLYFYKTKPSIIQRVYDNPKNGVGVIISSTISGFAAGILSAAFWQVYLQIFA